MTAVFLVQKEQHRAGLKAVEAKLASFRTQSTSILTNTGKLKNDRLPLCPGGIPEGITDFIFTDGIIGSGASLEQHVREISTQLPESSRGRIHMVCPVVSELGAQRVLGLPGELQNLKVALTTGMVVPEDNCAWMDFGEGLVYVVGVYDGKIRIGDYGDMVNEGLTDPELFEWNLV